MKPIGAMDDGSDAPVAAAWLSLGRASKLIGVNESTLRRWADDGRLRSFRTPGGHRRFAAQELQRLQDGDARPVTQEGHSLESLAVARIRRRLQRETSQRAHWYSGVGEEGRLRFRPLGRRLVALVDDCVSKKVRGGRLADEAKAIGREYGAELARDGVALRDAVEAFTFFRRSLDETARELAHQKSLTADESAAVWQHVSQLADVVLVAMTAAVEDSLPGRVP
jgi:excisionase family DNA binding protein